MPAMRGGLPWLGHRCPSTSLPPPSPPPSVLCLLMLLLGQPPRAAWAIPRAPPLPLHARGPMFEQRAGGLIVTSSDPTGEIVKLLGLGDDDARAPPPTPPPPHKELHHLPPVRKKQTDEWLLHALPMPHVRVVDTGDC